MFTEKWAEDDRKAYFTKAKEIAQRTGDKDLYQDSVGFINRIKGYRKGW